MWKSQLESFAYRCNKPKPYIPMRNGALRMRQLHSKKARKEKIPQRLRAEVWVKCMGENFSGMCWACNRAEVNVFNFHCAHILAEKHGGKATIANLVVSCALCNGSCGDMHLREFAEKCGFLDAKICCKSPYFI